MDSERIGLAMVMPEPSLKSRALRLLSGREYSRAELERKLNTHEQVPGQLAKALDELQAKGFINEQRVLESVIHRRSSKLGAARIRQELQQKGLDPQAVCAAVNALQPSEIARAREIWRKKFGAISPAAGAPTPASPAERARQMRFLAARGFGGDTIRRVVAGTPEDEDLFVD